MMARGSRLKGTLVALTSMVLAVSAASCGSTHAGAAGDTETTAPIAPSVSSAVPSSDSAGVSATPTTPSLSLPPGAQLETLTTIKSSSQAGVQLAPPAANDQPVVTAAEAYSAFAAEEPFNVSGAPSVVELATYTNELNSGIPTPGVSESSWDQSMLVWAIIYSPIGPIWREKNLGPAGPYAASLASASASASPSATRTDCSFVFLASASTGRYVTAFGACPGDLVPGSSETATSAN